MAPAVRVLEDPGIGREIDGAGLGRVDREAAGVVVDRDPRQASVGAAVGALGPQDCIENGGSWARRSPTGPSRRTGRGDSARVSPRRLDCEKEEGGHREKLRAFREAAHGGIPPSTMLRRIRRCANVQKGGDTISSGVSFRVGEGTPLTCRSRKGATSTATRRRRASIRGYGRC